MRKNTLRNDGCSTHMTVRESVTQIGKPSRHCHLKIVDDKLEARAPGRNATATEAQSINSAETEMKPG